MRHRRGLTVFESLEDNSATRAAIGEFFSGVEFSLQSADIGLIGNGYFISRMRKVNGIIVDPA